MESLVVCPACGQLNRSESRFCQSCGATLVKTCPQCGVRNRFCRTILHQLWCAPGSAARHADRDCRVAGDPSPGHLCGRVAVGAAARVGSECLSRLRPFAGPESANPPPSSIIETAFHIRLRLLNLDPNRQHSHRLFAQFFRPNGRLHSSRERRELVVAPAGRAEGGRDEHLRPAHRRHRGGQLSRGLACSCIP